MSVDGVIPQLDLLWDPVKAASNQIKHGVTFAQAATVLLDALALTVFDAEHSEFEDRWFTLGLSSERKLLAVSHTYTTTGPHRVQVRIISAREATRNECRHYEKEPRSMQPSGERYRNPIRVVESLLRTTPALRATPPYPRRGKIHNSLRKPYEQSDG